MTLEERMEQQPTVGLTNLIIKRAQKLCCQEITLVYDIPSGNARISYKNKVGIHNLFHQEYQFNPEARNAVERPIVLQTCAAILKAQAGLDYHANHPGQIGHFKVRSERNKQRATEVTVCSTIRSYQDNIPYKELIVLKFKETNEKYGG